MESPSGNLSRRQSDTVWIPLGRREWRAVIGLLPLARCCSRDEWIDEGINLGAYSANLRRTVRKIAPMYKNFLGILRNGKLIVLAFLRLLFPYIKM